MHVLIFFISEFAAEFYFSFKIVVVDREGVFFFFFLRSRLSLFVVFNEVVASSGSLRTWGVVVAARFCGLVRLSADTTLPLVFCGLLLLLFSFNFDLYSACYV